MGKFSRACKREYKEYMETTSIGQRHMTNNFLFWLNIFFVFISKGLFGKFIGLLGALFFGWRKGRNVSEFMMEQEFRR